MKDILKMIQREDVLFAIEQLDHYHWEARYNSTKFDMLYNGKAYPPKMVIRYAGLHASGEEPVAFGGGKDSNELLIGLGFTVIDKATGIPLNSGNVRVDEAEIALREDSKELSNLLENLNLSNTEQQAIVKIRIGQRSFRNALFRRYHKCALCGVANQDLLIASHIKPWSRADHYERTDPDNGLLLCPNHDALFDRGLISFSEEGTILISSTLDATTKIFLNVREGMNLELHGKQKAYMKWHRDNLFYSESYSLSD